MSQQVVYWHRDGCGQPAFLYQENQLIEGRGLDVRYAKKLNGESLLPNDRVECDSCGAPLRLPIRWEYFRRETR